MATEIIETFTLDDQQALVATGFKFADALTGAVLAAKKNTPLLLVREELLKVQSQVQLNKVGFMISSS